jgi:predicted dehydrogenase
LKGQWIVTKPKLRIGMIGAGPSASGHAVSLVMAPRVFDLPFDLELRSLADVTEASAAKAAAAGGFASHGTDWRAIIDDPAIDLVCLTGPHPSLGQIAQSAIAAGKHVFCDGPPARTAAAVHDLADAATAKGLRTQQGFPFLGHPMIATARELIAAGDLGQSLTYRGIHACDDMADPHAIWSPRHDPAGGGAMADYGRHALATAEFLMGPITWLMGDCVTAITERPDGHEGMRKVEVDDIGRAFLRFASGASGSIESSWISSGRKLQHDFEINGTKGALVFSHDQSNVLHVHAASDAFGRPGFRQIVAGPDTPPYGMFNAEPGWALGQTDLKTIQIAGILLAIAGKGPDLFNFHKAARIQGLVELIQQSSREGRWLDARAL